MLPWATYFVSWLYGCVYLLIYQTDSIIHLCQHTWQSFYNKEVSLKIIPAIGLVTLITIIAPIMLLQKTDLYGIKKLTY